MAELPSTGAGPSSGPKHCSIGGIAGGALFYFYDKATAKKLHDNIMSVGNSIPTDVAFRQFRGRDVDTDALMRDRGFPIPKKS